MSEKLVVVMDGSGTYCSTGGLDTLHRRLRNVSS